MKNNLSFFGHDTDALSHPKMQALVAEYGMTGYGRFWALNEAIGQSEEARLNISRKVNKLNLANRLCMRPAELDSFLGFLSDPEIDLINYAEGIITTDRTTENYRMVKEKREADRERKRAKRTEIEEEEIEILEPVKVEYLSVRNSALSMRKEQESKAKQTKVNNKAATAVAEHKNNLLADTLGLETAIQEASPDFEVIKNEARRIGIKLDHLSA
ncbi:MAG: DUF4373 domain-containing protein [Spirochaetaceae bacterium]|jgi:hypothetical protein|nr:DUF4373 domain-containing protein [Spirochaetaceae bacterium]